MLLDTKVVVDYPAGVPDAVLAVEAAIGTGAASISVVSVGKQFEGVYYGRVRHAAVALVADLRRSVQTLDLIERIAHRFAFIRGDLRRRGFLIGDADILIAATALHHGLTLVTRNQRHLSRVPDLTLYVY